MMNTLPCASTAMYDTSQKRVSRVEKAVPGHVHSSPIIFVVLITTRATAQMFDIQWARQWRKKIQNNWKCTTPLIANPSPQRSTYTGFTALNTIGKRRAKGRSPEKSATSTTHSRSRSANPGSWSQLGRSCSAKLTDDRGLFHCNTHPLYCTYSHIFTDLCWSMSGQSHTTSEPSSTSSVQFTLTDGHQINFKIYQDSTKFNGKEYISGNYQ